MYSFLLLIPLPSTLTYPFPPPLTLPNPLPPPPFLTLLPWPFPTPHTPPHTLTCWMWCGGHACLCVQQPVITLFNVPAPAIITPPQLPPKCLPVSRFISPSFSSRKYLCRFVFLCVCASVCECICLFACVCTLTLYFSQYSYDKIQHRFIQWCNDLQLTNTWMHYKRVSKVMLLKDFDF